MNKKLTALIIMDGYGLNEATKGNAIKAAKTPNIDKLFQTCAHSKLDSSGMAVGLPVGQMGNSEVGHTNIGAGRVVYQELTRITKSITDGDFFENKVLIAAMQNCKDNHSDLHIMGLLSDGGVHSHNTHIYALLEMAKQFGLAKVYVHCFLDGRDTPPASGAQYIKELENKMVEIGIGEIATVMGRYYSMDRDNRWERVGVAYFAMALGEGNYEPSAYEAVNKCYNKEQTDEFVFPTIITENNTPKAVIKKKDSVIFANFRPDRAREITRCFTDPEFNGFDRDLIKPYFVCMTQYDATMPNVHVAFLPQNISNTLGEIVSRLGLKQLRIAETEKYAHVTFFFNGGKETVFEGEDRLLIPSPKVATYDLMPQMSAYEVTDAVVDQIAKNAYDVIILNFANCDMVGHTGVFDAAVKAAETVDACVGRMLDAIEKAGGTALITADHGNADQMIDPGNGDIFTAHTTNPVPLILFGRNGGLKDGKLADISPTILDIMGIEKPKEMTGKSLLIKTQM